MDNMELWNKVSKPPLSALKQIGGGRLKGMTDISPQWRLQALTENFGPCGIGWKYTVDRKWTETGALITADANYKGPDYTEVLAFADISLYVKIDGQWTESIPGHGGSMMVEKEKFGPHTSDEAFKMAITDALSVALKQLGWGAEIYLGNFDGSKYKTGNPPAEKKETPPAQQGPVSELSKAQQELSAELSTFCNGDLAQMSLVLTEISHYDKDGKTGQLTLTDLAKKTDSAPFQRWIGASLGKLREKAKAPAAPTDPLDIRICAALEALHGDDEGAKTATLKDTIPGGDADYRKLQQPVKEILAALLETRVKEKQP